MVETSEKTPSPSSSSHGRKDLEFFKVYLPEFSSHQLVCSYVISFSSLGLKYSFFSWKLINIKINVQVIPQAFINILDKPLPKKVVLVDEIGRLWDVETKIGVVVFRQGWEKFANEHSLEFGDFLLFRYNGESRFDVTIFAKDGCKKDLDRFRVSVEKEPVLVKPVGISIKPEPWEDCGKRVMQNRKRVSVREEASVFGEIEPVHQRNTRKKVNRSRDPREMSWVPEKKHKGSEEPVYKPKNPHFVRKIAVGSLRLLEIPTTFLKANGIELEEGQDIELCDENGKKWPLKIEKHGRGCIFSYDSWLCFCESHNLRNPNKCLFEFIVSSNGTCSQILVRIFRGTLLTTATKSGYHVLPM
ncbi:putative B3 domain-containing protein At5g66980 isoform X1 [Brassica rapa]|uniref:putative B3 domain-containing protein At5g66980 isoform X1 n=1 Tax=Brassica campestris TaxID=3711 RepID=UPI00142D4CAA|nr:putative B3 domain-containing protein At5g66980 isoform X1 [Brassica rapa]